jgi:thiamine phosphate synthase YjbQ (UPF0047 family)
MTGRPYTLTLELVPGARRDVIDVALRLAEECGDLLAGYGRVLCCSHHTTAGFVEPALARRLAGRRDAVQSLLRLFAEVFPFGADYLHDRMELRAELPPAARAQEPPNADAHLTFIASGLTNCVCCRNRPGAPLLFVDLDGEYQGRRRTRTASVLAYDTERVVAETAIEVPVSEHAVASVNLWDRSLGVVARVDELVERHGLDFGRVELELGGAERAAAVTVNEFETLLMRHDLAEVLRDPLRFVARQTRRALADPRAVPAKSLGYARYDVVRLLNELLDGLGLRRSAIERLVAGVMGVPAERLLRLKRRVSLAVCPTADGSRSSVLQGRYQSPILIQWRRSPRGARRLRLKVVAFQ